MSAVPVAECTVENIGQLLTMDPASDNPADSTDPVAGLGLIIHAAVAVAGGKVVWTGHQQQLTQQVDCSAAERIDAGGNAVIPGYVDCHTHMVFAGSRAGEFARRLDGQSYEEILAAGGGIHATVEATRQASVETLTSLALERLDTFLSLGVTCVEAKSGYGLDTEAELKILRAAAEAGRRHPVEVVNTFLGAHTVPRPLRSQRQRYLDLITAEMLPRVAEAGLASFCDVFCDEGAFTVAEARRVLETGLQHGLRPKLHAEQLSRSGACELAAELGAVSADHLEKIDTGGASRLAASGTVAVLLPGATYFLGRRDYAPGRLLCQAGCRVAVSTDFNPGSCMSENLPLILNLACLQNGLYPREALLGATRFAAAALGEEQRLGVLLPGYQADLLILDTSDYRNVIYHFGVNLVDRVMKKGKLVYSNPSSRAARSRSSKSSPPRFPRP